MSRRTPAALLFALSVLLTSACGGGDKAGEPASGGGAAAPAASAGSGAKATGKIIEITMHTNEKGSYFEPAHIEAHEGDVLRFVLKTGVHNVNFVPDSNPGVQGLPPASAYLQIPGQKLDIPLNFGKGKFYFDCIPHVLLGMIGHVEVEDDDDDKH